MGKRRGSSELVSQLDTESIQLWYTVTRGWNRRFHPLVTVIQPQEYSTTRTEVSNRANLCQTVFHKSNLHI